MSLPQSAFAFNVGGKPNAPPTPGGPPGYDSSKLPPDIQRQINGMPPVQPPQQSQWPPGPPNVQTQQTPQGTQMNFPPFVPPTNPPTPQMPPYVQQQFGPQYPQQYYPQQPQQPYYPQQQPQQQWQQPQPAPQAPQGPKVVILLATGQYVDVRYAIRMLTFSRVLPTNVEIGVLADWRFGLAETRNSLIAQAFADPTVSHVFFLDSDILLPDGAVAQLLADNVPIASGVYWNSLGSGINAWVGNATIGLEQANPVVAVDYVGMGACLVHRTVFDTLKQAGATWPYFYYHVGEKPRDYYSEDFYFLELCNRINVKPHVDMRVKCKHIKPTTYEWNGETHMLEYGQQ